MNARVLLVMLFCFSAAVVAGPKAVLEPQKQKVEQGEFFTVDIMLREFPVTEGGGVTVSFDPEILRATAVVMNGLWGFASSPGVIDNDAGKIHDIVFAAFPGVVGNLPVATLWFQGKEHGKSRIKLSASGKNRFAGGGRLIEVGFERGKVKVTRSGHRHEHDDQKIDDREHDDKEHDAGEHDDEERDSHDREGSRHEAH